MKVYGNSKMLALLGLGVSGGLPLFLVSKTLQAWLTQAGVDLGIIGAFSLVNLPYSLKFLWSPALDRIHPPVLSQRRGWLLICQLLLFSSILCLSLLTPGSFVLQNADCSSWWCKMGTNFAMLYRSPFFWTALLIAFFSASQDIAADAYRTDILKEEEMGAGAAIFVLGYRFALVITGGLAFTWARQMSWGEVYRSLSFLMLSMIVVTLLSPSEEIKEKDLAVVTSKGADLLGGIKQNLTVYFIEPCQEFISRFSYWWLILLFIVLYRIGDSLVNNLSVAFLLQELRATEDQIGVVQSVGLISTIVGALIGGSGVSKLGIHRSLWVFGLFQTVSNLGYAWLAWAGNSAIGIFAVINLENFCGGLATAAFTAYLMSLCNRQFTATQYAFFSSLLAISRDLLVSPAGEIVKSIGWLEFFLGTVIVSLPGLILLGWVAPWHDREQEELRS